MITGKIRAWIEHCTKQGVLAVFISVPDEGDAMPQRSPAIRLCASLDEAKQWIETEARELGVPVEWGSGSCAAGPARRTEAVTAHSYPPDDSLTDDRRPPRTPRGHLTDLVVAEMRAAELLVALQAAVDGAPHWRNDARHLLRSIADLELPEPVSERLREIDARRRALAI